MNEETQDVLRNTLHVVEVDIKATELRLQSLTQLDEELNSLHHLRSSLLETLNLQPKEKT